MTTAHDKKVHEPFFHIVKRDGLVWWKAWIIRVIAVLIALVLCGIITVLLTGLNPIEFYKSMFSGAVGSPRRIWVLARDTAILLCVSLAVTPAFKMRFWNIGAEGQVLIGGLATAACMISFGNSIPTALLIPLMLIVSVVCSAVWGVIPAIFKAYWNTNETLFTLMMNYIAIQLTSYFCLIWSGNGSGTVGTINLRTRAGWLPDLGNEYLLNILIVALLTVVIFIYLRFSKHGYEISVVGESENTARYIGINVKKVIIRTMILSGALCGLAGFLLVGGVSHTMNADIAGGRGFTAIMVSWLAKFNPIFMVLTSFLIVFLEKGAEGITTMLNLNSSFSSIITGIIIFFIIGCEFFINYSIKFRSKQGRREA